MKTFIIAATIVLVAAFGLLIAVDLRERAYDAEDEADFSYQLPSCKEWTVEKARLANNWACENED